MVTTQEASASNGSGNWLFAVGRYRTWAVADVVACGDKYYMDWTFNLIMWQSLGWNPLSPRLFLPRLGRFAAPDYPSRRAFRCESRAAGEILIYARTRPLRGIRLRVRSPGLLRQIARICHSGRIRLSPEAARSRSRSPCVRSRRLHPRFSPRMDARTQGGLAAIRGNETVRSQRTSECDQRCHAHADRHTGWLAV